MKKEIRTIFMLSVFAVSLNSFVVFALDSATYNTEIASITSTTTQIRLISDSSITSAYIRYGTQQGVTQYPLSSSQTCISTAGTVNGQNTVTGSRCILLSGLQPSTTYYYKIITSSLVSVDTSSATVIKNVSNTSQEMHFTTLAPDPVLITPTFFNAVVTPGSNNTPSVTLSWENMSTNSTLLKILRTSPGAVEKNISVTDVSSTSFIDRDITSGVTYTYKIQSCSSSRCSDFTSTSIAIPASVVAPSVPTSLVLEGVSTVKLSWTDTSLNETVFEIYRGTTTDKMSFLKEVNANTSTALDTNPYKGTLNIYSVRACIKTDATPLLCSPFVQKTITVPNDTQVIINPESGSITSPKAPTSLLVNGSSTIVLTWTNLNTTPVNDTSFEIYRGTTTDKLVLLKSDVSSNSFYDYNPIQGFVSIYGVRSCFKNNPSQPCSPFVYGRIEVPVISLLTLPSPVVLDVVVPAKPLSPSLTVSSINSVVLRWRDVQNEAKYLIKKNRSNTQEEIYTMQANQTSYTDKSSISTGTTTYTIEACTSNNVCSPKVFLGSVVVPSSPERFGVSLAPSASSITLGWKDSSNEKFYKIKRSINGSSFSNLKTVYLNKETYTDTNLLLATYKYSIEACITELTCSSPVFSSNITLSNGLNETASSTTVTNNVSQTNATTTVHNFISFGDVATTVATNTNPKINQDTTNVIEQVLPKPPVAPTSIKAERVTVNGQLTNVVTVTWKDASSNETSFKILKNGTHLQTLPVNTVMYQDKTESTGNRSYQVESCNLVGCSKSEIITLYIPEPNYEIAKSLGVLRVGDFIQIKPLKASAGGSRTYTATVLENKLFSVDLPDDVYSVEGITPNKIVTIVNGKATSVVDKTHIKNIEGVVSYSTGEYLVGVEVIAYKASTNEKITTTTDSLGKFILKVSQGVWEVSVSPKGLNAQTWETLVKKTEVILSNENSDEIKDIRLTLEPLSSFITVSITDSNNKPLSNIGVIVDTISLSDSKNITKEDASLRKIVLEKTNSDGILHLRKNAGNYYIRTVSEVKLGYKDQEDKVVSLKDGETKKIHIMLEKEVERQKITLSGYVKFDDDTFVSDALVSAWSDQGGHMDTKTNIGGKYTIQLDTDQTWHIKSLKDNSNESYASTEQTIEGATLLERNINFTFFKSKAVQLAPVVRTVQNSTNQVRVTAEDGARITMQPNSTQASTQVNVEIKPTVEAVSQPLSTVVSTAYDITVKDTNNNQKITSFKEDLEILIPYDEEELKSKGVAVESVIPSYYDESISSWVPVTKFIINKEKKVFVLQVNHLTRFALIAAADTTAPLSPTNIVTDAQTPTDVRISWKNPTNDYHHAKVYRSETWGALGDIIAVEVLSNSFVDKTSSAVKKVYYYTVRSVDTAGNESNNMSQVAYTVDASLKNLANDKKNTSSLLLPPGQITEGQITRQLSVGSKGEDVTALQKALKLDGFYATGPITGYYGKLTENAVFRFQNYYKAELLIPNGYKIGTGVLGPITRKKINEIIANSANE